MIFVPKSFSERNIFRWSSSCLGTTRHDRKVKGYNGLVEQGKNPEACIYVGVYVSLNEIKYPFNRVTL